MRIVRDVTYRHVAGYLLVVGKTREGALQAAKKIGTYLLGHLAEDHVLPPRFKTVENSEFLFELPVILGEKPLEVKSLLARLVLAGTV